MCSKKLTISDTLDYILNDDGNFNDLESDWDFDEIEKIGSNSDEVAANVVIDDTESHNLHENEDSDIPENDDDPHQMSMWHLKMKRKNNRKNTDGIKLTLIHRKTYISNLLP